MEWYIIGALILLMIILLVFKMPNQAISIFKGHLMTFLKSQEAFLVQGIYNILPKEIRALVPSIYIAEIISFSILYIGQLLKEDERVEVKVKLEDEKL